jgi:hypothetical protein
VARYLEQQGLLERDADSSYLALENLDEDASALPDLYGHSITYRVFDRAPIHSWDRCFIRLILRDGMRIAQKTLYQRAISAPGKSSTGA